MEPDARLWGQRAMLHATPHHPTTLLPLRRAQAIELTRGQRVPTL